MGEIRNSGDLAWQPCFSDWEAPFLPESAADFFQWPLLTDLFPWQHSGAQFKRTWPIAPDRGLLAQRWAALLSAPTAERAELFRETRDRKISRPYTALADDAEQPSIERLDPDAEVPRIVPYSYRSLDRQYCIADARVGDFLRPALWRTLSARQLFMTSLLTGVLGDGPAAMTTNLVPDMDHFRGSFGAKHVIPLWRDTACTEPNVTAGLLDTLALAFAGEVTPEDILSYSYAVLSAPGYVAEFADELEIPGPRVPLTRESDIFAHGVALGRRLIWLHTFGERLVPLGERAGNLPHGQALSVRAVPTGPEGFPTEHHYDEDREELHVGGGVFAPVAPAVRAYSVSGLDVIGSWLDYRMRDGAGRRSSYLDRIRLTVWPAAFTEDLLRLLWIVEHTVALGPELDALLNKIVGRSLFRAGELPQPRDTERRPPS
jgi:hypothetical protein